MIPVFQGLDGICNGINTYFETQSQYLAGSVRVFRNGALLEGSLSDGWTELGNKKILMKEPPKATDIMQAYYILV